MSATPHSSTDPAPATPVTVLGLGRMGRALAAAFVAAGHPTTVWNRSPGKAAELVDRGATLAGSVEEAVTAGPLVVVCVSDDPAVHQLLDPLDGALAGRTLVNLTTGTSAQARANAAWARERGAAFLDGAIMAVPEDIATDGAVLLYSGPRDAYGAHEPVLRALSPAGTTYLAADPGLAALHELSLLGIMWGVLNGFLHGAALLGTAGVRAESFAPLAARMTGVVAGYVTAAAPEVDAGSYPAGDATLTVHQEAMRHLAEESEALGVNAELPRFFQLLADRAVADGHADSGYSALIEQFRKASPA
ncbi:NAD(P)-dependent oxidoreductase [Streptomyces sp. NPDC058372]|uniref:NAD(P)-dependent oxidoreductase n=1 Tax=unclassified Streptomyces TaxID=2593676 RepID=UPI003653AB90